MKVLATPSYLSHIKSLFPSPSPSNPWFIVAATVFSAANRPDEVPRVFIHAMEDAQTDQDKLEVASKIREALFKSGLITGYPKVINSLKAVHDVTPEKYRHTEIRRNVNISLQEYADIGRGAFTHHYGNAAQDVQSMLNAIYPDMGWFSNTIGYGVVYGFTDILSTLETSYALVASLIAIDAAPQIIWHQENARKAGASLEEVQAVRAIAMEVGQRAGIQWRDGVPEICE